mmetsp:Transcript_21777/g.33232  ORF Transcript_21777/g.33232 Transcript_21777/m.33232 type:complete len:290 (+) Transcript_21777:171-1040(+)
MSLAPQPTSVPAGIMHRTPIVSSPHQGPRSILSSSLTSIGSPRITSSPYRRTSEPEGDARAFLLGRPGERAALGQMLSASSRSLSNSPIATMMNTPLASSCSALPSFPSLGHSVMGPPIRDAKRTAMEAAVQMERARAKDLEAQEKNMTAEELRVALKRERAHSSKLAADLAALKSLAVSSQAEAEAHEEGRINGLMRRLEMLHHEKGRIIVELEREEEMLTNTLQKKLNEVRREKAQLEQVIEREQLSHLALKAKLANHREGSKLDDDNMTITEEDEEDDEDESLEEA